MKTEHHHIQDHHQPNEWVALRQGLQRYGAHVLTAALTLLVVLAGTHFYRQRVAGRDQDAGHRLASARSAAEFEAIVHDYPNHPVAASALISLAKLYYENGVTEQALLEYERFLTQFPDHELADIARLGRIFCIEARGDKRAWNEAADAFSAFASDHPGHYLEPQAIFGQARCLELLGRHVDARSIYEDFIAAHPDHAWTLRAEELLANVQRHLRHHPAAIEQAEQP